MAAPRSLLNTASSSLLHPNPISARSHRSRVSVFASPSSSDSAGSRVSCSATRVLSPPRIPLPIPEVVVEDDDVEELTFLEDQDEKPSSRWLTPQYLSLRLRCSSLMMKEASDALNRHFKDRVKSEPADNLPKITKKPLQTQHRQLHLINEAYERPVDFIKDVVISDIQEKYFEK